MFYGFNCQNEWTTNKPEFINFGFSQRHGPTLCRYLISTIGALLKQILHTVAIILDYSMQEQFDLTG